MLTTIPLTGLGFQPGTVPSIAPGRTGVLHAAEPRLPVGHPLVTALSPGTGDVPLVDLVFPGFSHTEPFCLVLSSSFFLSTRRFCLVLPSSVPSTIRSMYAPCGRVHTRLHVAGGGHHTPPSPAHRTVGNASNVGAMACAAHKPCARLVLAPSIPMRRIK